MPQAPLGNESRSEKVTHSLFFLSAVLFHLVLFMAVAGYVIWRTPGPEPETVLIVPPPPQKAPDAIHAPSSDAKVDVSSFIHTDSHLGGADSNVPPRFEIKIDVSRFINKSGPNDSHLPPVHTTDSTNHGPDARTIAVRHTVLDIWGRTPRQIADRDPALKFPVYVASYANGDWACNTKLDSEGNIVAGSIPDLVAKIAEWSHGEVKGEVVPKPLNIASSELLAKMPPFIFFTGHNDFVLTDAEVANLGQYLNNGGCIWGDNALAGEGSRFDVAFKREMKRVIPDLDKNFVPYSLSDEIFTKGKFPLGKFPAGMNYFAEPPQHLDIGGILAILYTPNDYSDMMFMRINPGDKDFFMTYQPIDPGTLFTNTSFVEKRTIFYRNFDLNSSLAVHRMGMDIITHMIIRFDSMLQLAH